VGYWDKCVQEARVSKRDYQQIANNESCQHITNHSFHVYFYGRHLRVILEWNMFFSIEIKNLLRHSPTKSSVHSKEQVVFASMERNILLYVQRKCDSTSLLGIGSKLETSFFQVSDSLDHLIFSPLFRRRVHIWATRHRLENLKPCSFRSWTRGIISPLLCRFNVVTHTRMHHRCI